ncbi:hypothetical protein GOM49_17535 [Clostridium bovifaecis]|uniref:Putative amidase domain-containing protein n=1 Tax=Clostridium bovifaecis TaxID=2184719 RepID=A0A6I6EWD1_9CLOT|nr:hypothetical protein GOM49_17535 [Clostridium bovifaecis]
MVEYNKENDIITKSNLNYDRDLAKEYAEKYALTPNTAQYPYFQNDDCANFISQVLKAGGMEEVGEKWDRFESWFCNTKNYKDLNNIAITWRAARYFRRHWGNEDGLGRNRAAAYTAITAQQALDNFDRLFSLLNIGDIIQYGNPKDNNHPYHTQVIHDKGFNWKTNRYDLFLAQHTENRLYVSFYQYLRKFQDKDIRAVYVYRIKDD